MMTLQKCKLNFISWTFQQMSLVSSDRGDFGASAVEILVFASPTGYM